MNDFSEKRKLDTDDNDDEGQKQKKFQNHNNKRPTIDEDVNVAPITVNMPCPQVKVRSVIGKKGCVIAEIIRESNCKIQIDQNFPEGHPRQMQLTGTPKTLSIAMAMLKKIIDAPEDGYDNHQPSQDDFYVPQDKVGSVIGHKGANISEIMRRTGCRIQIVQEGVPDGVDRLITFSGTTKQTAEAKEMVLTIITEGSSSLLLSAISAPSAGYDNDSSGTGIMTMMGGNGGLSVYEEDVDPKKVRVVIGQKGATVSQIERKSGCRRILLNQKFPPGVPHKIIYTGTPQQIEVAKHLVATVIQYGDEALQELINEGTGGHGVGGGENYVMQEMNVFQSQMVRLLGPHGSNVSDVQSRCGVKINIDTTPVMMMNSATGGPNIGPSGFPEATNKVTVIGSASESVQMAVSKLYEFIGIQVAAPPMAPPAQTPPGYPQQPGMYGMPPQQQMGQMMPPPMMQQQLPQYGMPVPQPVYGAPQMSAINNVGYSSVPTAYPPQQQQPGYPPQQQPQQQSQLTPYQQSQLQQSQSSSSQQTQQTAAAPSPVKTAAPGTVLALGEDGTSGQLEPMVQLPDGNYQQIAEITSSAIVKLLGKANANVALIKSKSGASVQVMKPDPTRRGSTKLFMTGGAPMVSLASQMIQEVLVNGTGKLMQMVDVPVSTINTVPAPAPSPIKQQMAPAPFLGGVPPQQQQMQQTQQPGYYPPQQQGMYPGQMMPPQQIPGPPQQQGMYGNPAQGGFPPQQQQMQQPQLGSMYPGQMMGMPPQQPQPGMYGMQQPQYPGMQQQYPGQLPPQQNQAQMFAANAIAAATFQQGRPGQMPQGAPQAQQQQQRSQGGGSKRY